jgi:hypothetical protein
MRVSPGDMVDFSTKHNNNNNKDSSDKPYSSSTLGSDNGSLLPGLVQSQECKVVIRAIEVIFVISLLPTGKYIYTYISKCNVR